MIDYMGAEDTALQRTFGRLLLVAAVRRVRQPGCKFDQIGVLEGPEGTGKSKALETIAGRENFSDQTILSQSDKEQQELLRGVWIYEIAELAGMRRSEVEKQKPHWLGHGAAASVLNVPSRRVPPWRHAQHVSIWRSNHGRPHKRSAFRPR